MNAALLNIGKKASTLGEQKSIHKGRLLSQSVKGEKASTYILPAGCSCCVVGCGGVVCPSCVCVRCVLFDRLRDFGFILWTSRTRLSGLLALLRHIAIDVKKRKTRKSEGVACSNRLARMYCSQIRNAPAGCPSEALRALVQAGVLVLASPAKVNQFRKASARYRIAPQFGKLALSNLDVRTNAKTLAKLERAPERPETGLNRRFPFRKQLLHDLALVTIPESAREVQDGVLADKDSRKATLGVVNAIATREHIVVVKPDGLIRTSLLSCPRALKPHLHLAGEPVALCDISSAHWMFLPRLLQDRLAYCRERGDEEKSMAPMMAEMQRLIELCSSGSFYASMCREGATDEELKKRKKLLNVLLNSPQSRAASNVVWRGLKRKFPHCFGIIKAIKRDNHRNISEQLRHFTAKAIEAALLEMQGRGLPAIPDTDCLIVRERDKKAACHAIGKAMFAETRGVCVTVGGMRFQKAR